MFEEAFARPPEDAELRAGLAYLDQIAGGAGASSDRVANAEPVWQQFAHALFNLKEFIYLR
jgi:hypothetical protein